MSNSTTTVSTSIVVPTTNWLYLAAAVFLCIVGSRSALLLGSASLRFGNTRLPLFAALLFSVQSVFALHFVAMGGLTFPFPWNTMWG